MKFVKAPVLFVFFAVLVSFTAMASLGDTVSAGGNTINTISTAPQAKDNKWQHREVKAAEKSAHQDLYANYINAFALIAALAAILISVKTANDNKKYNRSQTRAYVGVDNIVAVYLEKEHRFDFHIEVKNYGKSPAYKCTTQIGLKQTCAKVKNYPNLEFYKSEVPQSVADIWPDQTVGMLLQATAPINRNPPEIAKTQNLNYIISGIIKYRDIYNQEHYTKFCRYLDRRLREDNKASLTYMNRHNESN